MIERVEPAPSDDEFAAIVLAVRRLYHSPDLAAWTFAMRHSELEFDELLASCLKSS